MKFFRDNIFHKIFYNRIHIVVDYEGYLSIGNTTTIYFDK